MKQEDVKIGMKVKIVNSDPIHNVGQKPNGTVLEVVKKYLDYEDSYCFDLSDGVTYDCMRFEPYEDILKVGDTVKIVKKGDCRSSCWVNEMDKTVGMTGKIDDTHKKSVHVSFPSDEIGWWYPRDTVQKVESEKIDCSMDIKTAYKILQENCGIKEGDTVKVLRAWKKGELGTNWGDDETFKNAVGHIGKVVGLRDDHINVVVEDITVDWGIAFPFFVLEKIEDSKTVSKTDSKAAVKMPLELSDIPIEVLKAVREKWQTALDKGEWSDELWHVCAMCTFVDDYRHENELTGANYKKCREICSLAKSRWCTAQSDKGVDRLHINYHHYDTTEWLQDVAKFVCEINCEIARRAKDSKVDDKASGKTVGKFASELIGKKAKRIASLRGDNSYMNEVYVTITDVIGETVYYTQSDCDSMIFNWVNANDNNWIEVTE